MSGEGLQIGFNNRFMLDALKVVSSDEVLLEMSTPLSPIKLVPLEGDFFTYLVMPMRLKE